MQMVETEKIIVCGKVYMKNSEYSSGKNNEHELDETTTKLGHVLWGTWLGLFKISPDEWREDNRGHNEELEQ